jgi:hypothetical protein
VAARSGRFCWSGPPGAAGVEGVEVERFGGLGGHLPSGLMALLYGANGAEVKGGRAAGRRLQGGATWRRDPPCDPPHLRDSFVTHLIANGYDIRPAPMLLRPEWSWKLSALMVLRAGPLSEHPRVPS